MLGLRGDCLSLSPLGIPREPGKLRVVAFAGPNFALEDTIEENLSLSQIPSLT